MRKQNRRVRVPNTRVNHRIRAREIRLIDVDGNQIGIMPPKKALKIARQRGLALVEVSPDAHPSVCRIMDYGKYKYEQNKREKAKRQSKKTVTKEIKLRPSTAEHDYQFKKRHAKKFLLSGAKTIFTIRFRGRQITHPELARKMLKRIADELSSISEVLSPPKLQGRTMSMVLTPKSA
jgi:translation initiation factor IF-3